MRVPGGRGTVAVALLAWAALACSRPATRDAPKAAGAVRGVPSPTPTIDRARPFGTDDVTIELLARKLRDPDRRIRWYAARYLATRAPEAQPAVPALIEALRDDDEEVATNVAYALSRIGPLASAAVPDLVTLLGHERPGLREAAAAALSKIGVSAEAVPALIEASRVPDPTRSGARLAAFAALASLKPPTDAALQRLAEGMTDADPKIRSIAATALGELGPQQASVLDPLLEALEHREPSARRAAASAIARLGPAGAAAVPALYGALRDEDPKVRDEARRAIRAVRGP